MQSVLGKTYTGKWKHIGIFKAFSRFSMERELFSERELKDIGKAYAGLYELRRQADYENSTYESYTIERLRYLSEFVAEILSHVNKS
jgi:hypothetical protein